MQKKRIFLYFFAYLHIFLYLCSMNLANLHRQLYTWWERNKRELPWRETEDGYRIWLSEIILQQTRVQQGMAYYMRFVERWPSVVDLANASEDEVLREWQGLGYYSRARNLHKAARMIADEFGGEFPKQWDDIRKLPGVGDYTAGAIASFAYNLPYPALDGNVYRVLARLRDIDIAFDTSAGKRYFRQIAEQLLDRENARLFNSAIMELGALHCIPASPDCAQCPLVAQCEAYAHHTVEVLPVRKPRPTIRERYLNYKIYLCGDGQDPMVLIHQRMDNDIWKHLWEFVLEESDHLIEDKQALRAMDYTHVLSHQRLKARFLVYQVKEMPALAGEKMVRMSELDDYALSRLTLRALEDLRAA